MNKFGIGLIVAIVLASLGAAYLTGGLATKREEWLKQVVELKTLRDKNNSELFAVRAQRAALENDVNRMMEYWGRQWQAPGSGPLQGIPGVQLGVGASQGLAAKETQLSKPLPNVYLFATGAEADAHYLGEFQIAQVDANRAAGGLVRAPYLGETESWPTGEYRVRESIPPEHRAIFHDLHTQQTIADQQVIDETAKLKIQNKHLAESQKTLDLRLMELNGNAAAPAGSAAEVTLGLVESIRREEAIRNAVLKDVDTLRRSISDNYATLVDAIAENKETVQQMSPAANASDRSATRSSPGDRR